MSKAPHPKSALHLVRAPLTPMSRDEFTRTYVAPSLATDLARQRDIEAHVSRREFLRELAERREDEQAKRFWLRGRFAAFIAWLNG